MSKDKKPKSSGGGDRTPPVGSVTAEDEALTLFLNRLWAKNEPPERAELWQMFGRNKNTRGEMIFHDDFKPNEKLTIEQANKLANEIMEAAQNDCDAAGRDSHYMLAIVDRNRRAQPLSRRIGPLQPKRSYALKTMGGAEVGIDDGDEEALTIQALDLRRIKEANEQIRWRELHSSRLNEGMLLLQDSIIKNQQDRIDRLMDRVFASFEKMLEHDDRKVQREILLEKEKFKFGLMKDGARTVRNLLPGLFGGTETGAPPPQNGASNGNGSTNGNVVEVKHGPSRERTLVENLIHDIDEDEALSIAMFGNFEEHEGKLVQKVPGIISLKQYWTLLGVRDGRLPVTALDDVMPMSGHELAITQEQIVKAGAAGMTEGMGLALMEIKRLRMEARGAQAQTEATDTTNGTTTPA